ncbi:MULTISPECIES: class I SAM-dependent methyltransferase [Legionella]|uniref:Methyltransferase domain protein n=1 Tax=Legionella drozanskii LLAP-1 TaxID=1212489 RepID=A0A0W0SM60_9GAMM|nr:MULTISPECIES: class I SAM-dependent methyltransferase [Legionella]KTC84411.1 Methyltransferase domain protein [Legionella drozanskii LLAP-1]PJE06813.1 MAG: class I SAM-dependent methyltransferase [Legionella sp.]
MLKFNEDQIRKYKQSAIGGTGFLAFRDIEKFAKKFNIDLSYVLDLGCGSGRSTNYLSSFCKKVNGCDIDLNALDNARKNSRKKNSLYFENEREQELYQYSKYTSIFSILMFFHMSSKEEIKIELMKCYNSLETSGNLVIINGTKNLYVRNYLTVKSIGEPPKYDGDLVKVKLLNIDCEIKDFYWSDIYIKEIAEEVGFNHLETYLPLGDKTDQINYLDEIKYPPYYYIALRKNEQKQV